MPAALDFQADLGEIFEQPQDMDNMNFDPIGEDESYDYGYEHPWMSEILVEPQDNIIQDQLMTDAVSDHMATNDVYHTDNRATFPGYNTDMNEEEVELKPVILPSPLPHHSHLRVQQSSSTNTSHSSSNGSGSSSSSSSPALAHRHSGTSTTTVDSSVPYHLHHSSSSFGPSLASTSTSRHSHLNMGHGPQAAASATLGSHSCISSGSSSSESSLRPNGSLRSPLAPSGATYGGNAGGKIHYVVRHHPTVFLSGGQGATAFRHVVPKLKRPDSLYNVRGGDRFAESIEGTSSAGYLHYPPTPPGSSHSSDSELGTGGSGGTATHFIGGSSSELEPGMSSGGGLDLSGSDGVEGCLDSGPCDSPSPAYSMGSTYGATGFVGHRSGYSSLSAGVGMNHQPVFQNPIPQSGVLILTEEEKRTLIAEGYPIPARLPLTKQEERNLKKIRRKIKNKISAQESRRKKKEYLETLEKRVEAYSQENTDLKRRMENLETTNRSLLSQLRHLQQLAGKAGSTAASTCLMVLALCFAVFLAGGPQMNELALPTNVLGAAGSLYQAGYALPRRSSVDSAPMAHLASAGPGPSGNTGGSTGPPPHTPSLSRRLTRFRRAQPVSSWSDPVGATAAPSAGGDKIGVSDGTAPADDSRAGEAAILLPREPQIDHRLVPVRSRLLGSIKEETEDCRPAYGPPHMFWWSFLTGSSAYTAVPSSHMSVPSPSAINPSPVGNTSTRAADKDASVEFRVAMGNGTGNGATSSTGVYIPATYLMSVHSLNVRAPGA